MAFTFSFATVIEKRFVKRRVFLAQRFDHPSACRCIRRIGNLRSPRGEPFLLLQLDAVPWRIPQHYIKPAIPFRLLILRLFITYWHAEHIRECQMPVEELILLS